MATIVESKNGKKVVLLNPAERSKRYARELKSGRKRDGTPLTEAEAGFRMGVLNERKTQAKIYNRTHGIKSKSSKNSAKKVVNTKEKQKAVAIQSDPKARERYMKVMAEDFPQDFMSDDEWDYIDSMASWPKK